MAAQASGAVPIRPAPSSSFAASSVDGAAKSTACSTCTKRKVRCDRRQPCSTCRTGRFMCEYPAPGSKKRKRHDVEELQERLDRYERLLTDHGLLPKEDAPPSQRPERRPHDHDIQPQPQNGVLVSGPGPGETRYVQSHTWHDLADDLSAPSEDEDEQTSTRHVPLAAVDMINATLSGNSPVFLDLAYLYPSPDLAKHLWAVYLRNVDPIVKVIHGPSMNELFDRACVGLDELPKEEQCLAFAVYHFAMSSMQETERNTVVGEAWRDIQRTYYDMTRHLLVNCRFYQTTSLKVLQALILLLVAVRFEYSAHSYWILSGTAVRLGQRMGLHSPDERNLNPFDVQMRRRVWWQILIIDSFAAQRSGTNVATLPAEVWDSPAPLNIDDKDVWPGMTTQPTAKQAATDMMMPLSRIEITRFRMKAMYNSGQRQTPEQRDAALKSLEDTIETKYLRYCDVTDPTHYLILVGTRAALLNARLRTLLFRIKAGSASSDDRAKAFAMALKLLDHDAAMTSSSVAHRFAWQFQVFFSWEPVIYTLKELCEDSPPVPDGDVIVWKKLETMYAGHPNLLEQKRSIEVAIGRLTLRAWEMSKSRSGVLREWEPEFISQLRALQERKACGKGAAEETSQRLNVTSSSENAQASQVEYGEASMSIDQMGSWGSVDFGADINWSFWDDLIRSNEFGAGASG